MGFGGEWPPPIVAMKYCSAILLNLSQERHLALLAGGSYPSPKAASIKTFDDFVLLQFLAIWIQWRGNICCNFLRIARSVPENLRVRRVFLNQFILERRPSHFRV